LACRVHRELICMHSGIVNRNRSTGPRPLLLSIQALPAHAVFAKYSPDIARSTSRKPFGQAVPGSIGAAAAVRGVKFRSLVRGGRSLCMAAQAAGVRLTGWGEHFHKGSPRPSLSAAATLARCARTARGSHELRQSATLIVPAGPAARPPPDDAATTSNGQATCRGAIAAAHCCCTSGRVGVSGAASHPDDCCG
jgi:hypothetical protein